VLTCTARLESLTRALLEHETLDAHAAQLIDEANGEPVWPKATKTVSALTGSRQGRIKWIISESKAKKSPAGLDAVAPTPKWSRRPYRPSSVATMSTPVGCSATSW